MSALRDDWDASANRNEHEKCREYLRRVHKGCAERNMLASVVQSPWPSKWVDAPGPKDFDCFHELITNDELGRLSIGVTWAITGGLSIGLPAVMTFGIPQNQAKADKVIRECLAGEKVICLCVTEPSGGSDVANVKTTAKDCGDHYLVNGQKKYITNGFFADYFVVVLRTGGPGQKGVSMILMERTEGVTQEKMEMMGMWPCGNGMITFKDVKVPKTNIIGEFGCGFIQAMTNFNHERWCMSTHAIRCARTCIEESIKYARNRQTFGQLLIQHQVIKHKIVDMARWVEAAQNWIENITYQMCTMTKEQQNKDLGGQIAMMKVQAARTMQFCAAEAMQIFGGAGYWRSGAGSRVERIYREVKSIAIAAGSEEVMIELAASQYKLAPKVMPKASETEIEELKKEVQKLRAQLQKAEI